MANLNSIGEKVYFLLQISKKHKCTDKELRTILSYTKEHTDNLILGRFFGYSVSDYAIATLKWLDTDETNAKFEEIYTSLSDIRKGEISELIERELYDVLDNG